MTFDPSENGDTSVSTDVPQPHVVIFTGGEQNVRLHVVEGEMVDGVAMACV